MRDYYDGLIQEKTGKSGKPIYDIQRGKSRNPGMATISLIAEAFGRPTSFFLEPQGSAKRNNLEPDIPPSRNASNGDDVVEIIQLDLSVSMGPGTHIEDYVEEEPVKFDMGFIRAITRSPVLRLRLIRGVGDSMFPTLNGGDAIIVDTTERMLSRQDGIYWISIYGAMGIKRLRAVSKTRVMIVSDNPDIRDYEVDAEDLRIEGRAIWFARGL